MTTGIWIMVECICIVLVYLGFYILSGVGG